LKKRREGRTAKTLLTSFSNGKWAILLAREVSRGGAAVGREGVKRQAQTHCEINRKLELIDSQSNKLLFNIRFA
jgi:hypothetical protein